MNISNIAQALGRLGGKARATRLSGTEKKTIASLGGKSRAQSLIAAKRVRENFQYLAVTRHLQGPRPKAVRMKVFNGRLPGVESNE